MAEEADGCAVVIGFLILAVVAIFLIIYVVAPIVGLIVAAGSVWGGGHGCLNYYQAFAKNVSFEKTGP